MPKYRVEQYELHCVAYSIDAENEADAINQLLKGEASPIDDSSEYIGIDEDMGMSVNHLNKETIDKLEYYGIDVSGDIVPSIRSIEQVDEELPRDEFGNYDPKGNF